MKYFLVMIALLSGLFVNAQIQIKGRLVDSLTQKPIEFANIGLIGKGYGTVSDENGHYEFAVPDSLANEIVKVSLIGYTPRSYAVNRIRNTTVLFLQQASTSLAEVVVKASKTKIRTVGNETRTKLVSGGFVKNNLGAEFAVKLNIKHPQTQIRKVAININKNSLHKLPLFRLNLYTEDKSGLPGENILKQNIIIEPKDTLGLVEFDLKPYAIIVDSDVFISLEWIKDLGDAKGLYFSTKLGNGSTYSRLISQDKWIKNTGIGIGLYAEIAY